MTEQELKWLKIYEHAKRYYVEYHNLDIKRSYRVVFKEQVIYLGSWISRQRFDRKHGKLTYEQIKLLDEIGMIWDKSNHFIDEWNKMFKLAKKFYDTFGHLDIPKEYRVNELGEELKKGTKEYEADSSLKLGIWIINQRQAYKGIGNGKMTDEKKNLLNSIGMIWQIHDVEWIRMYNYAKSYYDKCHHLNIYQHYQIDTNGIELSKDNPAYNGPSSIKLGKWIGTQRVKKARGLLNDERASLLESIGMVWNAKDNKEKIKKLFSEININLENSILNKPYKEIVAKIAFLEAIGESVVIDSKLHPIFFMSDINMQITYNISLQELVDKYASTKVKRI